MKNNYFYTLIDQEITKLEKEYWDYLDKLNLKELNQRKSYLFLYWFLDTYSIDTEYIKNITDWSWDNSADIIFSSRNNSGRLEYYVIQSKWNIGKNCDSNLDSKTINGTITEFEEICRCEENLLDSTNEVFKSQYNNLLKHIKEGWKVNYIILSLSKIILEPKDQKRIDFFNSNLQFSELLIYDINKLKLDYLDKFYKWYKVSNPLINPKKPLEDIDINILDLNDDGAKYIKFPTPYESYIFSVQPRVVFELFQKYQYSIFQDNIRNPLMSSAINSEIVETLEKYPENFWYYNNWITGITKLIYPFNPAPSGSILKIQWLQIINWGQTFKTIAEYYWRLTEQKKLLLDANVKVMFKIIKSSSDEFDRSITLFTNSQNSIEPRDFYSNDTIQKKLQEDFVKNTNIWYETRRWEFIKNPPIGIHKVENTILAQAYLAFILDFPERAKSQVRKIFIPKEHNWIYEEIFNYSTKYIDLFVAYWIYRFVLSKEREYRKQHNIIMKKSRENKWYVLSDNEERVMSKEFILHARYHITMLYKFYFKNDKHKEDIVLTKYWYNGNSSELNKIYDSLVSKMLKHINSVKGNAWFSLTKYFKWSAATNDLRKVIK